MEPIIMCPSHSASGEVFFRFDQERQMKNSFSKSKDSPSPACSLRQSRNRTFRNKTNIDQSSYHDLCSPCTGPETNGSGLQSASSRETHFQQGKSPFQQGKSQVIDENHLKNPMKTKDRAYIRMHSSNAFINQLCKSLKDSLRNSQTMRRGTGGEQIGRNGIKLVLHFRSSSLSNSC